jgi:hypothetical protein
MTMEFSKSLLVAIFLACLSAPPIAGESEISRLVNICAEGNFLEAYAADLKRLDLEPLDVTKSSDERYRFEIDPAFSKAVLIEVRVSKDGTADATGYEIPSEREPNSKPKIKSKRLSQKQVRQFQHLLNLDEFWHRYHFGWGSGLDTWGWVFEGVRGADYQVFTTSDPAPKHMESAGTMLFRTVMGREIPR